MHFLEGKFDVSIKFSLKYVPWCSIVIETVLAQTMAWHPPSDKLLPKPMITQCTDAYMHHQALMCELLHGLKIHSSKTI